MTIDDTFELDAIDALQPLRFFAVTAVLYQLFDSGLYDALEGGATVAELATRHGWDEERLHAFLQFLRHEGYLSRENGRYALTAKVRAVHRYRGFYIMYTGGYGRTLLDLVPNLAKGSPGADRDVGRVGIGSTLISVNDVLPLIVKMIGAERPARLLEIGAGDGRLIVELAKRFPDLAGVVVEPSPKATEAAMRLITAAKLEDRVSVRTLSLQEFLGSAGTFEPTVITLSFVLQEVLGQDGEDAVVAYLERLFARFPDVRLLVTEMSNEWDNPAVMRHGMALAVLNMHYLLHPFTRQRLESFTFWESLFARAGLRVIAREAVDPRADSTGTIASYLLSRA